MTEPWSGCMECGHPAHPFNGNRDVRCGVPTNTGDPGNGPEECECVQWGDVLAAYAALESATAVRLREALESWIAPWSSYTDDEIAAPQTTYEFGSNLVERIQMARAALRER